MGNCITGIFDCFEDDGTERLLVGSTCVGRLQGTKRGQGFLPDNHMHTLINT